MNCRRTTAQDGGSSTSRVSSDLSLPPDAIGSRPRRRCIRPNLPPTKCEHIPRQNPSRDVRFMKIRDDTRRSDKTSQCRNKRIAGARRCVGTEHGELWFCDRMQSQGGTAPVTNSCNRGLRMRWDDACLLRCHAAMVVLLKLAESVYRLPGV